MTKLSKSANQSRVILSSFLALFLLIFIVVGFYLLVDNKPTSTLTDYAPKINLQEEAKTSNDNNLYTNPFSEYKNPFKLIGE